MNQEDIGLMLINKIRALDPKGFRMSGQEDGSCLIECSGDAHFLHSINLDSLLDAYGLFYGRVVKEQGYYDRSLK